MEIKLFEIRDRGTTIKAMAIRLGGIESKKESRLLASAGFGQSAVDHQEYVLFGDMDGGKFQMSSDAYDWDRTKHNAHLYVQEHWDELKTGDLVDVQFILGETAEPKQTEF